MQNRKISNGLLAAIIVFTIIIADQAIKIWVKTHFYLGETLSFTSWFELHFIENPGMAFGIELGSKLFLTLFRIVASIALVYLLFRLRNNQLYSKGFIVCLSLVTAGAIGNVLDCMFYGLIFSGSSPFELASLFPAEGGYGTFLHGYVVDMFHFPLIEGTWPDWIPWVGGSDFEFFRPVFNLADSAVSVGMLALIFFYSKYLSLPKEGEGANGETSGNE